MPGNDTASVRIDSTTAHACGGLVRSTEPAAQFFKPEPSHSVPEGVLFGTVLAKRITASAAPHRPEMGIMRHLSFERVATPY